jgi:ParB-like chromosome segregation protein Spo0J
METEQAAMPKQPRDSQQDCDAAKLAVEWTPIERVHGSPSNPRDNDAAVPHVAASIKRFGWQQPIVARADGEVIAGNTRLKAAHHLGLVEVPVVWFSGTDLDAVAYQIADNRTGELATWDEAALSSMLTALREEDALDGVGYSAEELQQVLEAAAPPVEVIEDEVPEPPSDPITKRGDLWLLGAYFECEDCGKSYTYDEGSQMKECPCG